MFDDGADVGLLRLLIMMILYCMLNNAKLRSVDMGMLLFIIQKTILSVIIINIPYSTLQMKEYYVLSFVDGGGGALSFIHLPVRIY